MARKERSRSRTGDASPDYASYSYMVGNVWFPVTGGLFLGDDAVSAGSAAHRTFSRLAGSAQYCASSRALPGATAIVGRRIVRIRQRAAVLLPFTGTYQQALAQYGQAVVDRIDFDTPAGSAIIGCRRICWR